MIANARTVLRDLFAAAVAAGKPDPFYAKVVRS